jgi:hypothetical protein
MKKKCQVCGKEFHGRSDKKYCGLDCKNSLNNRLRSKQENIISQIDLILHRNHHILSLMMSASPAKKSLIPKLILSNSGFNITYFTGTYLNHQGKLYHYIYDFARMEFSNQEV